MKRLFIQERGEEDYFYLKRRMEEIEVQEIEDERNRQMIKVNCEHYQTKESSREQAKR
jgi:hypothetical protein